MDISLEDFNALSAERSSRDVKIARLEMELSTERLNYQREIEKFMVERDALWKENQELRNQIDLMRNDYENLRYENLWMKQFILISVDRVRHFFQHIRNIEVLSAIKSFVLEVLPENATPEQIAFATKTMELPMQDDKPIMLRVEGNYNDIHDNNDVNMK